MSNSLLVQGPNPSNRYEVQFQKDCQRRSETNNLEHAKHNARPLAGWNLDAQGYDRVTETPPLARDAGYSSWINHGHSENPGKARSCHNE
jgi:hypothetical protein